MAQAEIASDAEIEHQSAFELLLLGSVGCNFVPLGVEEHTTFTFHVVFGDLVRGTSLRVRARGEVEVSVAVVGAVESTIG